MKCEESQGIFGTFFEEFFLQKLIGTFAAKAKRKHQFRFHCPPKWMMARLIDNNKKNGKHILWKMAQKEAITNDYPL